MLNFRIRLDFQDHSRSDAFRLRGEGNANVLGFLGWILDQYKERKPKDPTIREKFNTYRFSDYKERVIDLLMRVTTVSVSTVRIISLMKNAGR
jgi:hypothetical protein